MTAICAAGIPSDGDSGPPGGRLLRCCWSALLVRWFGNGAGDVASAAGGAEAAPGPGVEYVGYSVTANDDEIGRTWWTSLGHASKAPLDGSLPGRRP
jgi:hypothetical protein